ncbi:cobalamin biosynthesis protein [Sulfitobacter sp. G21635-S1]|uniref:cobalamin biosynthesis protein n=1 Tax=Sulfitobacter sp. G21635-S1 TaxID=3014043 RepID=UPI0022AF442E|nr:cobalamin biosynthesis protein [Sulfitobacter sp. G21635-S1]MCZ4257991.1 cobalamin biosynthesis protein [Sulfitobacter sp. G21635-S1]
MRVVGIGFRAAADLASLQDALQQVLDAAGGGGIDAVVTEAAKAREKVFREFAQVLGLPGLGITAQDLGQMITPTQSERMQDRFGTGSLAEAAALAAAGPQARLVAQRVVSGDGMATAALAES